MTSFRSTAAVLCVALFAAGCASKGSISGKVVADGAPLADQQVVLEGGAALATTTTASDGTYQFKDLDPKTFLLSVEVPSTLEGGHQVAVSVEHGDVQVPDLVFTSTASVSGTVTDSSGAPLAEAQVVMLGTQFSAVTDAQGAFALWNVPSGTHTLAVTTASGHANADLLLARGDAKQVQLTVVDNPPGTVTGKVNFFSTVDASLITVSVPGTSASAAAQLDGTYSLTVPAGTWELTASAPHYPSQKIGTVTVASGQTATVAPAKISLYQDLPTFGVPGAVWSVTTKLVDSPREAVVLKLNAPDALTSFYRFNLQTHALSLISVGTTEPVLSQSGAWAGIIDGASVLFVKPGTSESFTVPVSGGVNALNMFADGAGAWIWNGGVPGKGYAVKFADHSQTVTDTYLSYLIENTPDRVVVQTSNGSPAGYSLVTSAGITPLLTSNQQVNTVSPGPNLFYLYALQPCPTAPCPVSVVGPQATHPVTVQGFTSSGPLSSSFAFGNWMEVGDSTSSVMVNVTDGTSTPLLSGASNFNCSPDGSRIVFTTNGGLFLFENALPLPVTSPLIPVATSSSAISGAWVSANRYVGFNDAPPSAAAPYKFTIDSGTVSTDTAYAGGSGAPDGQFVVQYLGADGALRIQGGGPIITAPGGASTGAQVVRQLQWTGATPIPGPLTAVSWDGASVDIYGGGAPMHLDALTLGIPLFLGNEVSAVANGAVRTILDLSTGQRIAVDEPGVSRSNQLDTTMSRNPSTLLVAPALDAAGNPVGGKFAIFQSLLIVL